MVKIGIVENWQKLQQIIDLLIELKSEIKIVVDPVLRSSTNFEFQTDFNDQLLDEILNKIYLITPNYEEIQSLYPSKNIKEYFSRCQF